MERESVGLNDKVDIDWRTICTLGKVEKYMGNLIKAMEYYENKLLYEDYCELRKSVGWMNFPEVQTKKALERSFYTVTVFNQGELIAMGRLLGDGVYCTIVDVVVRPEYQSQGIGSRIVDMLLEYVESQIPKGGRASVQLIAEKGKETFYIKKGFKEIPHENCGAGMRKVICK